MEDLGEGRHVLGADAELGGCEQASVRVLLPELTPAVSQREDTPLELGQLGPGGIAVLSTGVPPRWPPGRAGEDSRGAAAAPRAGRPRGVRHADVPGGDVPAGAPEATVSRADQHRPTHGLAGVAEVGVGAVDGRLGDPPSGPPPRLRLQGPQLPLGAENVYSSCRGEGLARGWARQRRG